MTRDEVVGLLATDPELVGRLASDPQGVAAELGLSAEDLRFVQGLVPEDSSGGAEQLGQRVSRSSLSFGSVISHLLGGGHSAAAGHVVGEQQHAATPASPLDQGHDRSSPELPQQDGPDLPQHGGQGSGTSTPFHTGGSSNDGTLPNVSAGDDKPTIDVGVHHDDHRFGVDSSHSQGDKADDGKVNPGSDAARGNNETTTLPDGSTSTAHVDTGGHITSIENRSTDGTVTVTAFDRSGRMVGGAAAYPDGHFVGGTVVPDERHDGGPDGGTESSGPSVDPAWASRQHSGPGGDPEVGQEHGGPTLDPASASKVETGGAGTGGEGGTEAGPNPGLKPGEASTAHISENPTGYGTASYGKVDPNPVG